MNNNTALAIYEQAGPALLARQPATIVKLPYKTNTEWTQMRSILEQRLTMLRNWRMSWWEHWALLATYILPRRYHWLIVPNNNVRGLPINTEIVDPTGTQAMRICAAGLMSGMCSPSRPWFKLRPSVKGFDMDQEGQLWFDEVEERIYAVMAGSNYYDSKAQQYEDLVVFGTAPKIIYEDEKDVIRCYNPCAGEYFLISGSTFRIEGFARLFVLTVNQIIEMFGVENCPNDVQSMWQQKGSSLEVERIVAHMIEPNYPVQPRGGGPEIGVIRGDYTYREYYWIWGTSSDKPLSQRGFKELPFTSPRWAVTSNDPYGRSPGMDALPDIMQLQVETRRKAQGIEKQVNPPLLADVSMKNEPSSTLPGHVTYVPGLGPDKGMRPIYTVDPKLEHMTADIKEVQERIRRGFFNDLFLMIASDDKTNRTAYEIAARQQEKLQVLGPVIERLQNEDLSQDIKRIFSILARKNMLPALPDSLRNVPMEIEYISMLTLAQRAASTAGVERFVAMVGRVGSAKQEILELPEWEEMMREYADDLIVPHKVLKSRENYQSAVAEIKRAQAKAMQGAQAQQGLTETLPAVADSAKSLSETDTGGGLSALQMMLGGGAAGAGAGVPTPGAV